MTLAFWLKNKTPPPPPNYPLKIARGLKPVLQLYIPYSLESEKIREELKQTSMHYESKCEDYKLLEDRLQRTKNEYQTHINQLQKR